MWSAMDLAQVKSFVEEKEEGGLHSEVTHKAEPISHNWSKSLRLAIARALARKPEILIFDDSFSALDYKTDRILREELAKKVKTTTELIVAQRISTIMDADQILVLDKERSCWARNSTKRNCWRQTEVYQGERN